METQNNFTMQKYNLQKKKSSKRKPKSLQDIYNSIITNLKSQHKPTYYHVSKILI